MSAKFVRSTSQPRSGFGQPRPSRLSHEPAPIGEAKANGRVKRDFPKGRTKGMNIYSKRGTETAHTFLTRDNEAHYVDTRALLVAGQPETRTYRAVYVGPGDEEVGDPGNDLTITVRL